MSLAYNHIVAKHNRSAAIQRENQHMDEMEREAAPLMIAVAVLIVVPSIKTSVLARLLLRVLMAERYYLLPVTG